MTYRRNKTAVHGLGILPLYQFAFVLHTTHHQNVLEVLWRGVHEVVFHGLRMSWDPKRVEYCSRRERKFSYDRFFHLAVKIVLFLSVITCFLFGLHSQLCSLIKQLLFTALPKRQNKQMVVWKLFCVCSVRFILDCSSCYMRAVGKHARVAGILTWRAV